MNVAHQGEFKRILCQVDQYLLQSNLVSVELIGQVVICLLIPSRLCQGRARSLREKSFRLIRLAQATPLCEPERRVLHFHLRSKHVRYEIKGVPGVEHFVFRHELVFLDELQVEDVVD